MLQHKYIAIEGPIGVGKTSLAEILAKKLNARLVLEGAVENPFIADFYKDIQKHAFQTQMFFLLSRFKQQQELSQNELFQQGIISDYIFAKDRIFANLTLDDNELKLYEQIHTLLGVRVPKPDFVIYLQASTDVLLKRIALRGRKFENQITAEYLAELNQAYNYYFFHYADTPLMVVNTSEIDFVHRDADLDDLLAHASRMTKGTVYYQPVSVKK
ncbi:MAG TPA: deoxynucleoside kinase [bacterium]|nr:deoxynucleoside kinase [bacterium]